MDAQSVEEPGGACVLADPPDADLDVDFDLHPVDGACTSLAEDGGEVGAYALTSCVGHECG